MQILRLSEYSIKNIINNIIMSDKCKKTFIELINTSNINLASFVYNLISIYGNIYNSIRDENSNFSENEVREIESKFDNKINNEIFAIDKYDFIYSSAGVGFNESSRFNNFLYEDVYNKLEIMYTKEIASEIYEEIFDSIDTFVAQIETFIINIALNKEDDLFGCIFIKLEVVDKSLLIYVNS